MCVALRPEADRDPAPFQMMHTVACAAASNRVAHGVHVVGARVCGGYGTPRP